MDNAKESASVEKSASENPNPNPCTEPESAVESENPIPNLNANPPSRTPFTSLGQVDADLALARALQEQERAYMMLRMEGGGYVSSESGSYAYEDELVGDDDDDGDDDHHMDHGDEEHGSVGGSDYGDDSFDANDEELNPFNFESDEAFARALQDVEEREVATRLMALAAGLNDWGVVAHGGPVRHSQDAWQEVNPDELSYEELVALGEVVGTESRGLSADTISSLPSVHYKAQSSQDGNTDQCVICRLDYEDGDSLVALSCKHLYHPECINQWLQINKVCPICSSEVSTSGQ